MPRYLDLSHKFPLGGSVDRPRSAEYKDPTGVARGSMVLFNANTQKGGPLGKVTRCVLHWTAGGPLQIWDDYHYNIANDTDGEPLVVQARNPNQKGQHLYKRNTGALGFTWCASGPKTVTPAMIEMMAKLVAEVCHKHGLNPSGKTSDGFYIIDDHAAYARVDGYYPDRWDVGSFIEVVRSKAAWYHSKIQYSNGVPKYKFGAIL